MNEDKRAKMKQSLEETQKKLNELKTLNPNGNYEELEKVIQNLNDLLYRSQSNHLTFARLIKILTIIILPYIFCTGSVVMVLGFMNFILIPIEPKLYITIIPITSLILYLSFRIVNVISNQINGRNAIFFLILFGLVLIFVLACVDQTWIHCCKSFSDSLLLCFAQVLIALFMDLFCTQRLFYFLGDI